MSPARADSPSDAQTLVQRAAFQLLLARGGAIGLNDLAQHSGVRLESVSNLVDQLDGAGRIRRNAAGEVVGSGGLSVIPDRHEIELDGRRFWTWCAYDILGIFGVTGATGQAVSPSPPDGRPIVLHFTRGRPDKHGAVLFRPDEDLMTSCENVYEQWCPNSNLFASRELADQWADQQSLPGRVLDLDEASDLATEAWNDVIRPTSFVVDRRSD
jgi:alkylmercury lyase